jgi:transposase
MRPPGTAKELEHRRVRAVQLLRDGISRKLIVTVLGVSANSVSRWRKMATSGAIEAKPNSGRPCRLTDDDFRELEKLLSEGATSHGWPNNLWTAARVGQVIFKRWGIEYHHAHVGRLLRQQLNWTCQRPVCQNTNRDDVGIQWWVADDFPRILQEAKARRAHLVFVDETGFMLEPVVRRTYAPCGISPVLKISEPHGRISVIGAITISPIRKHVGLMFSMLASNANFRGPSVVQFLCEIRKRLSGPMTIVWDRILIHSCDSVEGYLALESTVNGEFFPPYAPELNPVDQVWGYIKHSRLANFTPPDLAVLRATVTAELQRLRGRSDLLKSFIRFTHLPGIL